MSRYTTTDVRSFSTFFLKKYGKLEPECSSYGNNIVWSTNGVETGRIDYDISTVFGDSFIRLSYKTRRYGDDWQSMDYKVPLESVRCNFGGIRWYFRCPLTRGGIYCGKRVAFLYHVGDYFGCRECADLTYESCNELKRFRGWPWNVLANTWKADSIYEKLRTTHYKGSPTRKYKRCLELWSDDVYVQEAEEQLYKEL